MLEASLAVIALLSLSMLYLRIPVQSLNLGPGIASYVDSKFPNAT